MDIHYPKYIFIDDFLTEGKGYRVDKYGLILNYSKNCIWILYQLYG